jgi:hypothetical protein
VPLRIAFNFDHAGKSYEGTYQVQDDTKIEVATPFGTKLGDVGNELAGKKATAIAIELARGWRSVGKSSARSKR